MRIKKEYAISLKYWLLAIAVFSVLYFGGKGLTGLATLNTDNAEFISIDQEFNGDGTIEVPLDTQANVSGMSISGKYLGKGTIKVFLEAENSSYLVYEVDNSQEEPSGSSFVTGLAVNEEDSSQESQDDSPEEASSEQTPAGSETTESGSETPASEVAADEQPSDETTESGSEASVSEETADEQPNDETNEEENIIPENPAEPVIEEPEDNSSEEILETPANESEEQSASEQNETAENMTNEESLNETEVIINNTADINETANESNQTEIPVNETTAVNETEEITNNTGNETGKDIPIPQEIWENFLNECEDTCSLKIDTDKFMLRIEITGDIELKLSNISYTAEEKPVPQNPMLIKDIPDMDISPGNSGTLDLEEYFSGNALKFEVDVGEGVRVRISGNTATIRPADNFFGNSRITFSASNDFGTAKSNEVIVRILDPKKEDIIKKLYEMFPAMEVMDAIKENNLYSFVLKFNDTEIRITGIRNESDVMGNITTGVIDQEITI